MPNTSKYKIQKQAVQWAAFVLQNLYLLSHDEAIGAVIYLFIYLFILTRPPRREEVFPESNPRFSKPHFNPPPRREEIRYPGRNYGILWWNSFLSALGHFNPLPMGRKSVHDASLLPADADFNPPSPWGGNLYGYIAYHHSYLFRFALPIGGIIFNTPNLNADPHKEYFRAVQHRTDGGALN